VRERDVLEGAVARDGGQAGRLRAERRRLRRGRLRLALFRAELRRQRGSMSTKTGTSFGSRARPISWRSSPIALSLLSALWYGRSVVTAS